MRRGDDLCTVLASFDLSCVASHVGMAQDIVSEKTNLECVFLATSDNSVSALQSVPHKVKKKTEALH